MIKFFIGAFIGLFIGFFICACLKVSSEADTKDRIFRAVEKLQDYNLVGNKEKVIEDVIEILRGDE